MTETVSAFPTSLRLIPSEATPSESPLVTRARDVLYQRFAARDWITRVDVADDPSLMPPPPSSEHVRQRVTIDGGRCWVQVCWRGSSPDRDAYVRAVIELAQAALREEELLQDRSALWKRVDDLRERMVERNRLTAIGTMAAGVTHDVRSPLSVLVTNMSYLEHLGSEENVVEPEELASITEDNRAALDLIVAILESMRTFVQTGDRPSVMRVEPVVQSAARLSEWHFRREQVRLEVSIEDAPFCVGTAPELCQVLLNLMVNAADAAPKGSVVRVVAHQRGDETRVWVADEGSGIAADQAEAVFEPFHTSKPQGMGLGLSLARENARRHGGDLRLLDHVPAPLAVRPPRGAVFELTLPASIQPSR